MSFDYDKLKKKDDAGGGQWTSYSDLFMVLSVVFLLLYVTASLRNGTHTLQQQMLNQSLVEKAADLENQIKVYNSLKQDYLKKQASAGEQKVYKQLMSKITLLKEENLEEASTLRKKAFENEKKEAALNQYQQIIRNIINANVLSKARLKRKDKIMNTQRSKISNQVDTIATRDKTIVINKREIASLDKEVETKKLVILEKNKMIALKQKVLRSKQREIKKLNIDINIKKKVINKNKRKISKIDRNLKKRIRSLQSLRKNHKLTKKLYNKELKRIQKLSKKQISKLNTQNKKIKRNLVQVNTQVSSAKKQLSHANRKIASQKKQTKALDQEITSMQSQIKQTKTEFKESKLAFSKQVKDLETQKNRLASQRNNLQTQKQKLEKQKKKLLKQKTNLKKQKKELAKINKKLNKVNTKLKVETVQLNKVQRNLKNKTKSLNAKNTNLVKARNKLSGELKKAQSIINAKKQIAKQIISNFKKAGVEAKVDEGTGEVFLTFGKSFFDSGRANLKSKMRTALNKFMPIYAASLFKDPKIAKKIKSVDIVGFASPTYGGRYVNPNSLNPRDRKAIDFNTNLSIERAKSVFRHIIDTNKLKYAQQNKITPLLKVSGRSYFTGGRGNRAPAKSMSTKEFCAQFDCKKEQKVVIRFELDD